jgi:hypothetical protein
VRVKKPIALFFYPEAGKHPFTCSGPNYCVYPFRCRAGTFGCTREACQFRDALVGMYLTFLHGFVPCNDHDLQRKRSLSEPMSRSSE